jgi:hypothetical protein
MRGADMTETLAEKKCTCGLMRGGAIHLRNHVPWSSQKLE